MDDIRSYDESSVLELYFQQSRAVTSCRSVSMPDAAAAQSGRRRRWRRGRWDEVVPTGLSGRNASQIRYRPGLCGQQIAEKRC